MVVATADKEPGSNLPTPSGDTQGGVLVEFVSANPYATLTVAHGRNGVIGDVLAALFAQEGRHVQREFYVNDAPNSRPMQAHIAALLARYRATITGEPIPADSEADRTVRHIRARIGSRLDVDTQAFATQVVQAMLFEQDGVLRDLGIRFDNHFFERSLAGNSTNVKEGEIGTVLQKLKASGYTYEQSGALWLRASALGDVHDQVLVRADGLPTYLASDLTYHCNKFERGFDHLIDVWSGDHVGYIARTRAGLTALGYPADRLQIVLCGPTRIVSEDDNLSGERDRSQADAPLATVLNALGADRARFFLLLAPPHAPLELDLDAAMRHTPANPLYRIWQAYTRSVWQPALPMSSTRVVPDSSDRPSAGRDAPVEALVAHLAAWEPTLIHAATHYEPHHICEYVTTLAERFRICGAMQSDPMPALRHQTRLTLESGFAILGIAAPTTPPPPGEDL